MTDKEKEKLHQILSSLWKNDDSVGKMCYNQALQDAQIAIDSLQEEPVSENFENALAEEWKGYNDRGAAKVDALEDNTQELAFAKGFYRGTKWQKKQDQETIELAEDHAMLAGMEKMKEELMAKAIDAHCFGFQGAALFSFRLPADNYLVGSEIKVIVIKED